MSPTVKNNYHFYEENNYDINFMIINNILDIDNNISYKNSKIILSFEKLEDGWHYGEGISIKKNIIEIALELDRKAYECGYFETDAFPGLDGEAAFTIYYGDDYFEFMIENNGMINFSHEYNDEEINYDSKITFEEALTKIERIKDEICTLSELSTKTIIGTTVGDVLTVFPSKTYEIVYQSYPKNALLEVGEEFASISNSFMEKLWECPLFIGDSPYMNYPIPVK